MSSQCPVVLIEGQGNLKYIMYTHIYIYLCEHLFCQPAVFVRKLLTEIEFKELLKRFFIKSLKLLIKNEFYIGHYSENQVLNDTKKKDLRNSYRFNAI